MEIYKFVLIPNFGNIAQITVHSTYENIVDVWYVLKIIWPIISIKMDQSDKNWNTKL